MKVEGKLLDGRKENAPSGTGLLGILGFAAKAGALLAGGKPALTEAAGGAGAVKIDEVTLLSVEGKKTIQGVGEIRLAQEPSRPDFNGDGRVDFADFIQFARVFGKQACSLPEISCANAHILLNFGLLKFRDRKLLACVYKEVNPCRTSNRPASS